MEDKKRKQDTENNVDQYISDPDYGGMIIEMVHNIDNQKFLCFMYKLLSSFKKKWGI